MNTAQNTEHLFVYGTLRDEINHPMGDLLQKYTQEVRSATFCGKLFDAGAFPAAITSDNEADSVHGELYTIRDPQPFSSTWIPMKDTVLIIHQKACF